MFLSFITCKTNKVELLEVQREGISNTITTTINVERESELNVNIFECGKGDKEWFWLRLKLSRTIRTKQNQDKRLNTKGENR